MLNTLPKYTGDRSGLVLLSEQTIKTALKQTHPVLLSYKSFLPKEQRAELQTFVMLPVSFSNSGTLISLK